MALRDDHWVVLHRRGRIGRSKAGWWQESEKNAVTRSSSEKNQVADGVIADLLTRRTLFTSRCNTACCQLGSFGGGNKFALRPFVLFDCVDQPFLIDDGNYGSLKSLRKLPERWVCGAREARRLRTGTMGLRSLIPV